MTEEINVFNKDSKRSVNAELDKEIKEKKEQILKMKEKMEKAKEKKEEKEN